MYHFCDTGDNEITAVGLKCLRTSNLSNLKSLDLGKIFD